MVPAGVTSGVFDVYGAQGGSFADSGRLPGWFRRQGRPRAGDGRADAGSDAEHARGRQGGRRLFIASRGTVTVAGGFNGGGTNTITCTGCCHSSLGGAGGGSSDLRTSADGLADRLLVAGGGGGAGVGAVGDDPGTGGDSATAAKSVTAVDGLVTCSGGGAGTLLGPGAAGDGAAVIRAAR